MIKTSEIGVKIKSLICNFVVDFSVLAGVKDISLDHRSAFVQGWLTTSKLWFRKQLTVTASRASCRSSLVFPYHGGLRRRPKPRRQSRKRRAATMTEAKYGPYDKATKEAFDREFSKDKILCLSHLTWEPPLRDGAYVFTAISGRFGMERPVRGFVFNRHENRKRSKTTTDLMKIKNLCNFSHLVINAAFDVEVKEGEPLLEVDLVIVEEEGVPIGEFLNNECKQFGVDRAMRAIYKQLFQMLHTLHTNNFSKFSSTYVHTYLIIYTYFHSSVHGDIKLSNMNIITYVPPGKTRTELMLKLSDYSEITDGDQRVFIHPPFGYAMKHLPVNPQRKDVYTAADELEIAAMSFKHLQDTAKNNTTFENLKFLVRAVTAIQKREVLGDQRISAHFINLMSSFAQNMKASDKQKPGAALTIKSIFSHCLFFEPAESLEMIASLCSYAKALNEGEYATFKNKLRHLSGNLYIEKQSALAVPPHAEWFTRLGPSLQNYVESHIKLARTRGNTESMSDVETIAENRCNIYTLYNVSEPLHLLNLIRNVWVHWLEVGNAVRTEIIQSSEKDPEEILKYFTLRYPGLIVTIYEFMSHEGIASIKKNTELKKMRPRVSLSEEGVINNISEIVSDHQVIAEKQRATLKTVKFF